MFPVSMLKTDYVNDLHWEVSQRFDRRGKIITICGYGTTKAYAIEMFQQEVCYAEMEQDFDMLQDIGNLLWDIAGWIDQAIKATKAFLQFVYDEFGEMQ